MKIIQPMGMGCLTFGLLVATGAWAEQKPDVTGVVAPAVSSSPGFGNGLGAVGLLFFRPDAEDTVSPNSTLTLAGLYSDTDSYFLGAFCPLYLSEDHWRVSPGMVRGRVRSELNAGSGVVARFDDDFTGGFVRILRKVDGAWYAGGGLRVMAHQYQARNDAALDYFDRFEIEDVTTGMVSAIVALDTRDDQRYPTGGQTAELTLGISPEGWSAGEGYTTAQVSWAGFVNLQPRQVLAMQVMGQTVSEDAPYYERPTLGQRGDLRGYTPGEIVGDHSLSAQGEWRAFFTPRLGGVLFAGLGALWESGLDSDDVYPSCGIGLRVLLQEENKVTFRVDYAVGEDDQDGWYVSVAEAF